MGREVRMVASDWKHPIDKTHGGFVPLYPGWRFEADAKLWDEDAAKWERGEYPDYADEDDIKAGYLNWAGRRPDPKKYMPNWTPERAAFYMMYETATEGTPISPAFITPEDLARWLADTGANAFAGHTASYEDWLYVAKAGVCAECDN